MSFTMTTAGALDIDNEITIALRGMQFPLEVKFNNKTDTRPFVQAIGHYVLLK